MRTEGTGIAYQRSVWGRYDARSADEMQPNAVLFSHLFCRNNFATKLSESNKLMLDGLQASISFVRERLEPLLHSRPHAETPHLIVECH